MTLFVLVHSPSAGPGTWSPVAGRLTAAGCAAVVPSLLAVGTGCCPGGVARCLLELAGD
ncbi:MAG TPA: hypothetical protein VLW44_18555 [Streptosporangiaceae bacterium]|nr:hypothetical protein [Streptosporangiaceae bacterium]